MARATTSLPVPVSPLIRTVTRFEAISLMTSQSCRIAGLCPINPRRQEGTFSSPSSVLLCHQSIGLDPVTLLINEWQLSPIPLRADFLRLEGSGYRRKLTASHDSSAFAWIS